MYASLSRVYRCWDLAVLLSHLVFPVSLFQGMSVSPCAVWEPKYHILIPHWCISLSLNKTVFNFSDNFLFHTFQTPKHYHPFCTPCLVYFHSAGTHACMAHAMLKYMHICNYVNQFFSVYLCKPMETKRPFFFCQVKG